jgi:RNA polymerase sigma-70 factor (ECF subfamily)
MTNLSDKQLLEYFRGGVVDAYLSVYDEYSKEIRKYLLDICSNPELADELAEDSFKRIWGLRGQMKSKNHLLACLYLIARQLHLWHLVGETPGELAWETFTPEAERWRQMNNHLDVTCNRILVTLDAAMRSLTTQRKQVLRMLFVEGQNTGDIATRLRIEEQTVTNTKGDALKRLRKDLNDCDLFRPSIFKALLIYLEQG